jgi:transcriptional regulator with PAS, ATPase and Fis domain
MLKNDIQKKYGIISVSKEIKELVDIAAQLAKSDVTVLLIGESGVGKELFASLIHNESKRKDKPFIRVNCGAIPEGIIESELFGHKKGAFTSAIESRKGYFELADKGTIFLDEIGDLPLTTQVKLLRVLENKEFMPVGAETVVKVDVRVIAATNKDLQKEVQNRRFREDLFFRLKAVTLVIPPLRKRKADIPLLIDHFLEMLSQKNKTERPVIESEAMDYLLEYEWPGNIRELKNAMESAFALSKDGTISLDIISKIVQPTSIYDEKESKNLPALINLHKEKENGENIDMRMIFKALVDIKKNLMELKEFAMMSQNLNNEQNFSSEQLASMKTIEKEAIKRTLEAVKYNKRKAAAILKISPRTLYRKIKEYDLEE